MHSAGDAAPVRDFGGQKGAVSRNRVVAAIGLARSLAGPRPQVCRLGAVSNAIVHADGQETEGCVTQYGSAWCWVLRFDLGLRSDMNSVSAR